MAGRLIAGFIAAVLAVLVFHQPIIWLLANIGLLPPTTRAYSMAAQATALPAVASLFKSFGLAGWPQLFNGMFWGGLWGALFAVIHQHLPGGSLIVKGLLFGLLVLVVSNWLAIPLLRGQPIFAGFVPMRMLAGALILGGFGIGTGLFYGILRRNA